MTQEFPLTIFQKRCHGDTFKVGVPDTATMLVCASDPLKFKRSSIFTEVLIRLHLNFSGVEHFYESLTISAILVRNLKYPESIDIRSTNF